MTRRNSLHLDNTTVYRRLLPSKNYLNSERVPILFSLQGVEPTLRRNLELLPKVVPTAVEEEKPATSTGKALASDGTSSCWARV